MYSTRPSLLICKKCTTQLKLSDRRGRETALHPPGRDPYEYAMAIVNQDSVRDIAFIAGL